MKNEKGAISIFAFFAMAFFLIFIMIAYNNVALKGKTGAETEEALADIYDYDVSADNLLLQKNGNNLSNGQLGLILKTEEEKSKISSAENVDKYIFLNNKYYLIDTTVSLDE